MTREKKEGTRDMGEGEKRICECCGKNEAFGVYASAFGPLSVASCKECLANNAESLGNFFMCFDLIGGTNVVDGIKQMKAYKDGEYIDFDEITELYEKEQVEMTECPECHERALKKVGEGHFRCTAYGCHHEFLTNDSPKLKHAGNALDEDWLLDEDL